MGTIPEDEQKFITENVLGLWWVDAEERFLYEPVLDPEEALIEKITEKTGWCVKSISYCENRPHPLTTRILSKYFKGVSWLTLSVTLILKSGVYNEIHSTPY